MKNLLIRIAFVLVTVVAYGQDDVLLKAMQDELDRSMKELKIPEGKGPFFIMYGVQDQTTYSIAATYGSIIESNKIPARFKSTTRVLVGDYEFNDESVDDNTFSSPTAWEIGLPMNDDYWGIRRSFWSTTDKVYRDAARHFNRNEQYLKESGKTLEELPHRSFAKGEAVKILKDVEPYEFKAKEWEDRVRRLSALFVGHPTITNSAVVVGWIDGLKYLVSSEGTVVRLPVRLANVLVFGQSRSKSGEVAVEQISYAQRSVEKLPSEEQLKKEIEAMIARIENSDSIPKLQEEYTGPVLIMGRPVADFFVNSMMRGKESIMASDQIKKLTGFQYGDDANSMEGKIGKSIMNEKISVKATPKLKTYNEQELLGSYEIDDEGIVPADETVVIENGVLKELLNNRSLTSESQVANGFSNGPGVLQFSINMNDKESTMKERLIAEAKKQGLEFGLLVRDQNPLGFGLLNVFRVYVKDGREEFVKHAVISAASMKDLRKLIGASSEYRAYNLGGSEFLGGGGPGGRSAVSVIVPGAILMEELDVQPFRMPILKQEEYVTNPLAGEE